jgi:hypothetical protein
LKFLDILQELYHTSLASGTDATSLQPLVDLEPTQAPSGNTIDPLLRNDSAESSTPSSTPTPAATPATTPATTPAITPVSAPVSTPASVSRTPTPFLQMLAIQRKRRLGKGGAGGTQDKRVRLAEAVQALADAKTEAAQVIATAAKVKNDVPEAIAILSAEFTKEPMKLSGDDMQRAIDCLRNPDNATLFVTLSKQPEMKEHRERWFEGTTGIYFFNENGQLRDVQ